MEKANEYRIKQYSKGFAIEFKEGLIWKNLHAELYNFPDKYYFDTLEQAEEILNKIKNL